MLKKNILCLTNAFQLLFQTIRIKKLIYLEANFGIFIRKFNKKCQLQKKSPDSLHLSFCHIIISLLCWRQSK